MLRAEAWFDPGPDRYKNPLWRRIAVQRIGFEEQRTVCQQSVRENILAAAREQGRQEEIAKTLYSLAILKLDLGQFSESLEYSQASYAIYKQLGDTSWMTYLLGVISVSHLAMGQPEKRVENARQQLKLARENNDRLFVADA